MLDLSTQIDKYIDAHKMYCFENATGVRRFEKLLRDVTGLDSRYSESMLHAFFEDNPGAIEVVIEWIKERNSPEWIENMKQLGFEEDSNAEDETEETAGG